MICPLVEFGGHYFTTTLGFGQRLLLLQMAGVELQYCVLCIVSHCCFKHLCP